MVSRAQLLKRNPAVIAARALIEKNAINPDRVDLDSLQVIAMGDKSVQVRAEIMVTVPLNDYLEAIGAAHEDLAESEAEVEREAQAQAIADQGQAALEETEFPERQPITAEENDDDGF